MAEDNHTIEQVLAMSTEEFELHIKSIESDHRYFCEDRYTDMRRRHEDEMEDLTKELQRRGATLRDIIISLREARAEAVRDE